MIENKLKKGLGRGLSSLIGDNSKKALTNKIQIQDVFRNKFQPRKYFNKQELEDLSSSIKERGVIQPIIVRPSKSSEHKYELIAGERRWLASQNAGLNEIPAVILDIDDAQSLEFAIVENVQRHDLNAIEEAEALEKLRNEYQMTHDDIAKFTGKSRSHVTNIIRLNDLTEYIKSKLIEGLIEMGHARAVLSLNPKEQDLIIKRAINKKLSVRAVESLVKKGLSGKKTPTISKGPDTLAIERELSEILGADLNISHSSKGKGRIQIKYNSIDELQGIIKKFRK